MRISGERIKRTRPIQTEIYVVAVDVEMVIPVDGPSKPCYEAETMRFLREVKEHAERNELNWMTQHGKVYAAVGSAYKAIRRLVRIFIRWQIVASDFFGLDTATNVRRERTDGYQPHSSIAGRVKRASQAKWNSARETGD